MLTIRFNRIGKKNKAYFRLVVQEHTIAPGGGHVEILGSYNPHLKKESLKSERIKYWVEKGVTLSDTAYNFLVSKGIIVGQKRAVKFPKKAEASTETEKAPIVEKKEEAQVEKEVKEEIKEEVKEAIKPKIEKEIEKKSEVKVKAESKSEPETSIDKKKKEA
jgi:ribosomal protein S16